MGVFLTIGYCSKAIVYCFPYCFLEMFLGGGKAVMKGDNDMIKGCLPGESEVILLLNVFILSTSSDKPFLIV